MAADDAERDLPGVVAAALADLLERPRWLVAFSGGLDSTVLLHLLWRLLSGPPGGAAPDPGRQPSDRTRPDLLALHANHGLSPHADAWQRHCEALCRQWGIASCSLRVSLPARPPGGLESAAREARYAALESCQRPGVPTTTSAPPLNAINCGLLAAPPAPVTPLGPPPELLPKPPQASAS